MAPGSNEIPADPACLKEALLQAAAHARIDEHGNEYVGVQLRFWNVYQNWTDAPQTVDDQIRYSKPHWAYVQQLLDIDEGG